MRLTYFPNMDKRLQRYSFFFNCQSPRRYLFKKKDIRRRLGLLEPHRIAQNSARQHRGKATALPHAVFGGIDLLASAEEHYDYLGHEHPEEHGKGIDRGVGNIHAAVGTEHVGVS